MVKVCSRSLVDLMEQRLALRSSIRLWATGLQFDAGTLGQYLQRLAKVEVLLFHDEGEYVTSRIAGTKTVPRSCVREHDEGGRLFSMEGTEPLVTAPCLS